MRKLSVHEISEFQNLIWQYFRQHGRDFSWRKVHDPYLILVSEIMLQQTQTQRVSHYFELFTNKYPTIEKLSEATLKDVLKLWSGLGYNRRAKYLWELAKILHLQNANRIPNTLEELRQLPGIGPATAGAILAYAFNLPVSFIETNIRTVFLYTFFHNQRNVTDTEILNLVNQTKDLRRIRDWYYALTDYGVHLKQQTKGINQQQSKHYQTQSKFIGSTRQLRSIVIKLLLKKPHTYNELRIQCNNDVRLKTVLDDLEKESFLKVQGNLIKLIDR